MAVPSELAQRLLNTERRQVISNGYKKVLVVDDDKVLVCVVQAILEGEGYEVRVAGDGEQGYAICQIFRPEIVVADIWMPHKNGLEMMQQIRRASPKIKTLYISGEPEPVGPQLEEERKRFHISILKKPFSREELTGLIVELSREEPPENSRMVKEET